MSHISTRLRRLVRERANGRCEYCLKPEGVSAFSHQVEHIIAIKHGGSSDPDNLAYACVQCNGHKGSDVASYDEDSQTLVPLFNPRSQRWDEHFLTEQAHIIGKTPAGRVTVRLLHMNEPEQVETRRRLLRLGRWP